MGWRLRCSNVPVGSGPRTSVTSTSRPLRLLRLVCHRMCSTTRGLPARRCPRNLAWPTHWLEPRAGGVTTAVTRTGPDPSIDAIPLRSAGPTPTESGAQAASEQLLRYPRRYLWRGCQRTRGGGEPIVHRRPQRTEQVELGAAGRQRTIVELDNAFAELDGAGVAEHDRYGLVSHRQLELAGGRLLGRVVSGVLCADLVQFCCELVEVDAGVAEHLRRGAVRLLQYRLQDVVAAHGSLAGELRSHRQHVVRRWCTARPVGLAGAGRLDPRQHIPADPIQRVLVRQDLGRHAFALAEHAEQNVLGADVVVF